MPHVTWIGDGSPNTRITAKRNPDDDIARDAFPGARIWLEDEDPVLESRPEWFTSDCGPDDDMEGVSVVVGGMTFRDVSSLPVAKLRGFIAEFSDARTVPMTRSGCDAAIRRIFGSALDDEDIGALECEGSDAGE